MMRLRVLQARNFRNFARLELACGPRLNILVGDNGQGKTNVLESIHVLGQLRSFRGVGRAELTCWGEEVVSLKGVVEHPAHGEGLTLEAAWDPQRRVLKVQGHEISRTLDYLGRLSTLVFCADSAQLVKGPPQERRRLVDRALVSLQPAYLSLLQRYHLVLKQRNQLLRGAKPDRPSLEVWNAKFVELGADVMHVRCGYLRRLNRQLMRLSDVKLGNPTALQKLYQPALGRGSNDQGIAGEGDGVVSKADLAQRLTAALATVERDELRFHASLVGPQRDDVGFRWRGHDLRSYGSQGEQRLAMFLLLVAMQEDVESQLGMPPVVLLDDMISELDRQRRDLLWEFLHTTPAQVFLTGTELTPELKMLCAEVSETQVWTVEAGTICQ